MPNKKIELLPPKPIISENDLILIVDSEDANKNKVTTIKSLQRKNLARTIMMSFITGI